MTKIRYFISLVLGVLTVMQVLVQPSTTQAKWYSSFNESAESLIIENTLTEMTLEQKVGQLFIFGFVGKKFDHRLLATIRQLKPGGIIVFGRNIESAQQMIRFNTSIQKESQKQTRLPLLIALDQEGGEVSRIRFNPPLPSALSVGMTADPVIAERMGYLVGQVLNSLGFNMNLAPVLDLSDPNIATFIGTRSFGKNPSQVASMASAYAQGLEMANVLSTGKHFPGHGGIQSDSHLGLPYKTSTVPQLLSADLLPYNIFSKALHSSAVMIAHIAFPNIDSSRLPATFSKVIVGDLLRQQLNYHGLVVTDDIEMAAAGGVGNFEDRAIKAIDAGADMVMVASSLRAQKKAVHAVIRAVKAKRLDIEKINEANRRIIRVKNRLAREESENQKTVNIEQFNKVVASRFLRDLTDTVLEKNFYSSLNNLKEESYIWSDRPVYVFSGSRSFYNNFKGKTNMSAVWVPYTSKNPGLFKQRMTAAERSYGVFYLTGKRSARILNSLPKEVKARTFVVNATIPGLIKKRSSFIGIVNIFSHHPSSGKLVAENIIRSTAKPATKTKIPSRLPSSLTGPRQDRQ